MPEARLSEDEAQAILRVLRALTIRSRTGELGVLHGLDRFVSSQAVFKRNDLEALDSAARKVGLAAGVRRTDR